MESPRSEELYRRLKRLYCDAEEEGEIDGLNRSSEIHKLVNSMIKDLADPLQQELNATVQTNMFDGKIDIDGEKILLYKTYRGNIPERRYKSLLDMIRTFDSAKTTFFLFIARSFSDQDKKIISGLKEEVDKAKVRMCFMDYKALISLHRYNSKIYIDHDNEESKLFKGLFLENFLKLYLMISQTLFDDAWLSTVKQFHLKLQEPRARKAKSEKLADGLYGVDLTKIDGDGAFLCPNCGAVISPDDETEETYTIIETKVENDELAELTLMCNHCRSKIKLTGFLSPSEETRLKRPPSESMDIE